MKCCSDRGCDEFFTESVARRDANRYRRAGIDDSAQRVVEFVRGHGIEGRSVLEVGGGVGAIQLELLRAGVKRTLMPPAARSRGTRRAATGTAASNRPRA